MSPRTAGGDGRVFPHEPGWLQCIETCSVHPWLVHVNDAPRTLSTSHPMPCIIQIKSNTGLATTVDAPGRSSNDRGGPGEVQTAAQEEAARFFFKVNKNKTFQFFGTKIRTFLLKPKGTPTNRQ